MGHLTDFEIFLSGACTMMIIVGIRTFWNEVFLKDFNHSKTQDL